jgi:hypothetical protein
VALPARELALACGDRLVTLLRGGIVDRPAGLFAPTLLLRGSTASP